MAKKNSRDNLGYLGVDFQYKLIKSFMDDHKFFRDLNNIIDQNMFTDPNLKTYVGVLKEYFETYDVVPSYSMMNIELRSKASGELQVQFYEDTIKKLMETSSEGAESIRDKALKFFKQQNIIKTANEILKIAGDGDISKYDRCVDLLQEALNKGTYEDMGTSIFDNIEEVLSDDYRCPIPTGIGKVDEVLEGGLGKGELGVIIGPTSFGKTSMTTAMASYAATYKCEQNNFSGYKVLQIVFEDREKQIQRKHLARISGIEAKDLSKEDFREQVKKYLTEFEDRDLLKNNLLIKRFPSGEVSASKLKRYIQKLINAGFKPDMVIVDYFECVEPEQLLYGENEWNKEGKTMRKLESMAGELDIALWVPTQGTKDSINLELVTMDKAGGSAKKVQIGHIIMSIARTMEDMDKNLATIAILKNRAGKSGKVFNGVEFNNGTCRISTDHVDEFDSMMDYNKNKEQQNLDLAREIFKKVQGEK